jgi:hypothetical protein
LEEVIDLSLKNVRNAYTMNIESINSKLEDVLAFIEEGVFDMHICI